MIEVMRSIRPLLGSLVIFPIVVAFFGSQWSWDDRFELNASSTGDGSDRPPAALIPAHSDARAELPRPLDLFRLELRGDGALGYRVLAPRAA
jgi:hypothetical protein